MGLDSGEAFDQVHRYLDEHGWPSSGSSGAYCRESNVDEARIVSMIEVKSIIGAGTGEDLVRQITEWYYEDGTFAARHDPCAKEASDG